MFSRDLQMYLFFFFLLIVQGRSTGAYKGILGFENKNS